MASLVTLANTYRNEYRFSGADIRSGMADAARKYIQSEVTSIVDAASVGIALEALVAGTDVHLERLSDQAREAYEAAFPNVPIESLHDASQDQLQGMLNAWKGKLFEVDVRDQLNSGEWVGDWHLDSGQTAELAASPTQEGWDPPCVRIVVAPI
jgi:hypothetical protein